jgi:hypothetical protein
MNAIGYFFSAVIFLGWLGGMLSWLYGLYHGIAMVVAQWRAMPSLKAGIKEIFWPKIHGVLTDPPSNAYLIHRNKSRRAMAIFFASFLLVIGATFVGDWVGALHSFSGRNDENVDCRSRDQQVPCGSQPSN